MKVRWYWYNNKPYPQCTRCGTYPLQPRGVDEQGHYLEQCGTCGRIFTHKTPLHVLQERARARW